MFNVVKEFTFNPNRDIFLNPTNKLCCLNCNLNLSVFQLSSRAEGPEGKLLPTAVGWRFRGDGCNHKALDFDMDFDI